MEVKSGDRVELKGPHGPKVGTVLKILNDDPFGMRVRWEDGQESNIYPSEEMFRVLDAEEG